jgi:hypothetical protein
LLLGLFGRAHLPATMFRNSGKRYWSAQFPRCMTNIEAEFEQRCSFRLAWRLTLHRPNYIAIPLSGVPH